MHRFTRRPSPGAIVALIALVVAGTGTATATTLITSANVRDGSLTGRDIKDHTITAHDLSRSLTFKRLGTTGAKGDKGDQGDAGPAGADGAPGVSFAPVDDAKPAFPQQVNCRIELPAPANQVGDAAEDQDDSGRASINFNEQTTLDMNRGINVTKPDNLELGCWQPKRTGKGDGVVITGIKVLFERVQSDTNLNPDPPLPDGGFEIGPDTGTPQVSRAFHFNNGDERILVKGIFQDQFDAEVNGVTNPTKDQLATTIVTIPVGGKTFADCAITPCKVLPNGRYLVWAHVRTDKVRRSTDVDKLGRPTKQAPHVQPDEDAEPLQSQTLLP